MARDRGRKASIWSPRHKHPCGISSRKGPKVSWWSEPIEPPLLPRQLDQLGQGFRGTAPYHWHAWEMVLNRASRVSSRQLAMPQYHKALFLARSIPEETTFGR